MERDVKERIEQLLSCDRNAVELLEHIKYLRNACAKGTDIQELIISDPQLVSFIHEILFHSRPDNLDISQKQRFLVWQLLANSIVNNTKNQEVVWSKLGESIAEAIVHVPLDKSIDIQLMIVYNILTGNAKCISELKILRAITCLWQNIIDTKCNDTFEYLHFLFEHFLVSCRSSSRCYANLQPQQRIAFLDYTCSYLRHESPNGAVASSLLNHFASEVKTKSDCILRYSKTGVEAVQPREAYYLLRVIATASGSEQYGHVYREDHSLFLTVSSMLRCVVAAGKTENSAIKPLERLEEVATASKIPTDFEKEISFELKTILVRCVANLLYENKTNTDYCMDTDALPALLECTNMDARNPLMKEWSILAIRNACAMNPQVQDFIANLTNKGFVPNTLMDDLNLNMGSLRIKSNV